MDGHTYGKKSMDQPGKVACPARGQLNRKKCYFPVRVRSCLTIWSRETGSPVPFRASLLMTQYTLLKVLTIHTRVNIPSIVYVYMFAKNVGYLL